MVHINLHIIADGCKFDHSRQVAKISGILARHIGYTDSELKLITEAAAYHDIGKLAVSPSILNKPGALTPEEFEIVKTHTRIGFEQLSEAAEILTMAAMIAHYHHEKYDGNGGYHGLAGVDINPVVRLVTVADVFDALLSRRPYKDGWSIADIKDYFSGQAGKQFDSAVVAVLLTVLDEILNLYRTGE